MTAATRPDFTVLIVAKSPVPGLAKTRLCAPLTSEGAADVAALEQYGARRDSDQ